LSVKQLSSALPNIRKISTHTPAKCGRHGHRDVQMQTDSRLSVNVRTYHRKLFDALTVSVNTLFSDEDELIFPPDQYESI